MKGHVPDVYLIHVRLVGEGQTIEFAGYAKPVQTALGSLVRHNLYEEPDKYGCGPAWLLWGDGKAKMVFDKASRYVWCQIYPWEARQAALVLLLLGERGGMMHKDVARMFARAVYCTRHCAEWRRPDTYHLG